jgi:hypothetical protein
VGSRKLGGQEAELVEYLALLRCGDDGRDERKKGVKRILLYCAGSSFGFGMDANWTGEGSSETRSSGMIFSPVQDCGGRQQAAKSGTTHQGPSEALRVTASVAIVGEEWTGPQITEACRRCAKDATRSIKLDRIFDGKEDHR